MRMTHTHSRPILTSTRSQQQLATSGAFTRARRRPRQLEVNPDHLAAGTVRHHASLHPVDRRHLDTAPSVSPRSAPRLALTVFIIVFALLVVGTSLTAKMEYRYVYTFAPFAWLLLAATSVMIGTVIVATVRQRPWVRSRGPES